MKKTFNRIKPILFISMIIIGLLMIIGGGKTFETHIIGLSLGVCITAVGGYFFTESLRM